LRDRQLEIALLYASPYSPAIRSKANRAARPAPPLRDVVGSCEVVEQFDRFTSDLPLVHDHTRVLAAD